MGGFIESLKEHPALRWLLIWGGVLVAIILAIHFFSKKQSSSQGGSVPPTTINVKNTTTLNNGYPPTSSTPPSSGGGSGNGFVPPPTPFPGGTGGKNSATQLRLTTPTSLNTLAGRYTGGQLSWLESWNQNLKKQYPMQFQKPWWTLPSGTVVNIPHKG